MRKNLLCTFALLSSIFFSGTSRAQSAPTVSYTNPVNGPVGTSIKIVGNNFGSTQSSSTIAFNGTTATPTSWSNTQIVAPVPTGATTGPIVVTVGGVASNHVNFTVGTPPTISYTNPVNGPAGTSVTIVGTYFGATLGTSTLAFNGTSATPTSWSSTQIVAPVPTGATTGPIIVTVGGVASNHVNFTVGTPPTISYTNPIDGPVGTTVTVVGNYFGSTQGSSTITFNGTPATPTTWSNTQIVAAVPSGAVTGPVVVTVGGIASNHVNFIVGTPPTISYTNPIDGPAGASITIVGNYFGSTVGNVTFNGTAATPASWSNTQIVVPVPNGASTGPLVVTAGGMASNQVNFIVGTPPTISYTNPVRAAVGSSIAIVGNYFGSTQGSSTITFNGTAATPSSWGDTQITVPIPAGSSTGPLVIAVGGMNSNSVNFTVVPNIISLSPSSGPSGTTVTIAGTTFGLAQGSSTVTFNGTVTSPSSWSDSQIAVPVPSGASTGPVVVTAAGNVSNSANFTFLPTPSITSVSPTSGSAGASVTITGANFGPTQGSSFVTFNGTAAIPTSWSPTSIVVPVPNGASTGNIVVTESNVASNGASFTVATGTPPTITAAASPAPNASGWSNSNVTVTFTCTPGGAAIANCPSPQIVSSESTNQVISGTTTDANGLAATASVTLNIDKTIPILAVTSPVDGTGFSNAAVTVSGTVSDARSGVSSVTCNGAPASASGSNFSCNISLNVGVNLVVVRATDLAGNVAASNFHVSLAGTLPAPQSLQIAPAGVNMLVGETRQFTAVDELGRPRSDATWTISDTTLATISTDSSPVLTAVAVGQPTLTATIQSLTAQVQLNILSGASLAPGTVRWSAPPVPGLATRQIIQAVPTIGNVPDLYTHEGDSYGNGYIRAFTADGLPMWQTSLGPVDYFGVSSDGLGGILASNTTYDGSFYPAHITTTLTDRDPVTGTPVWTYSPGASIGQRAIRQDGTIFLLQTPPEDSAGNVYTYLVALDGNSGTPLFNLLLPNALTQIFDNCHNLYSSYYTSLGVSDNLAIDLDGTVNLAITARSGTSAFNCDSSGSSSYTTTLSLFQLKPNGSTSVTPVRTATVDNSQPSTRVPKYDAWQVIPDGQGGTLVAWVDNSTRFQPLDYVTHVSTSGNTDYYFPSLYGPIASMVLGENGTAYLTDVQTIQAFDINSGPLWNYVSPVNGVEIVASSAGGGLVANEFSGTQTVTEIQFDANGNRSALMTTAGTDPSSYSWSGDLYGIKAGTQTVTEIFASPASLAGSLWALPGGNQSGTGLAIEQVLTIQPQGDQKQLPDFSHGEICNIFMAYVPPPNPTCGNVNAIELLTDKSPDYVFQQYIQTFVPGILNSKGKPNNGEMIFTAPNNEPINITGPGQKLTIALVGIASKGQGPFSVLTERFDPVNHVISVVTLKGHPLSGWRYWRVYSIGPNDLVIETGAYDQPGPGIKNYAGYYLGKGYISKGWYHYLQFIQNDLHAVQGSNLQGTINGRQINTYRFDHDALWQGYWDFAGDYANYLLNNVCLSTSCN